MGNRKEKDSKIHRLTPFFPFCRNLGGGLFPNRLAGLCVRADAEPLPHGCRDPRAKSCGGNEMVSENLYETS